MTSELESRRQAIADALREAMSAPVSAIDARAGAVSPSPLSVVPDPDDEIEAVELETADEADDEIAPPAVPPLEPLGQMSPVAARALFGHH